MPTTELPKLHERAYYRLIRERVLEVMRQLVREQLLPMVPSIVREAELAGDSLVTDLDSWATTLSRTIEGVRIQMARRVTDAELEELIRRNVASGVAVANGQLNRNQLRVLLGVDILGTDPELRSLVAGFVEQNVGLIKSIPRRYFEDLQQLVMGNVRAGRRASVIQAEIEQRYPRYARNAELIARDQTAKLNSEITRKRHEALGITQYIWRTAKDDRVRPRHRELEGQVFSYDKPPVVDHRSGRRANPGEDYQCRCTAEPVIPGLDDKRRRTPATVRAARRSILPKGVPPGYERQATTPRRAGWDMTVLEAATKRINAMTSRQRETVRRELNAAALREGLVNRAIVNAAARDKLIEAHAMQGDWLAGRLSFADARRFAERATGRRLSVDDTKAGREALRRLLAHITEQRGAMVTVPWAPQRLGTRIGALGIRQLGRRVRGAHYPDTGEIGVAPDVGAGFARFVQARGKGVGESEVSATRTILHETVHSHSPMRADLYTGVGKALEEATTELAAHHLIEAAAPGWRVVLGTPGPNEIESSYRRWVRNLVAAVSGELGVPWDRAMAEARKAALAMRRDVGPVAQDVDAYLHRFAAQLPNNRAKVRAAERTAAKDFDAKLKRARTDPALAKRLLGTDDPDSPDAIVAADRERAFRIKTAGLAVTAKTRRRLSAALKGPAW